jgi:hypothetical protein
MESILEKIERGEVGRCYTCSAAVRRVVVVVVVVGGGGGGGLYSH